MAFRWSSLIPPAWLRREPAPQLELLQERRRAPRRDTPYHAVCVTAGHPSCEAAKQLGALRFLAGQAPSLPLVECNVRPCECRYSHYADRRTGLDRRVKIGEPPGGLQERRLNHGRRAGDAGR